MQKLREKVMKEREYVNTWNDVYEIKIKLEYAKLVNSSSLTHIQIKFKYKFINCSD